VKITDFTTADLHSFWWLWVIFKVTSANEACLPSISQKLYHKLATILLPTNRNNTWFSAGRKSRNACKRCHTGV